MTGAPVFPVRRTPAARPTPGAEAVAAPRARVIPVAYLEALVTQLRLRQVEWRVIVGLLVTGAPLTARQLARWLGLDYATTKRAVRELVLWGLLDRVTGGVQLQPDWRRWRPPVGTDPQR